MKRELKAIHKSIDTLSLDLNGLTVLTELASNHYLWTPIIALMAGAKKVYAWIEDSSYGKASEIVERFQSVVKELNLSSERVEIAQNSRPLEHVRQADIVTNLNFIRPLDKELVNNMRPTAVIPYMYESWEMRSNEVDLEKCKKKGIKVAGTNENFGGLGVFDSCGPLAVKLAFEAGMEVANNDILIVSDGHFGDVAESSFRGLGAKSVARMPPGDLEGYDLSNFDFLFLSDYASGVQLVGQNGVISEEVILTNEIQIVHLVGEVDLESTSLGKDLIYPYQSGSCYRMTRTLAHLGPDPVIKLHTAGLKVGELLMKNEESPLVQRMV